MNIFDRLKAGVHAPDAAATAVLARELAAALPPDCTLALHGDLGSGKTTFVAAMAPVWGIKEAVTSPSYNLFSLYKGETRFLAHLDAYRLQSDADMDALMIEEFLQSPWCLAVEWPERVSDWLPEDTLHLYLEDLGPKGRRIRLEGHV